MSLAIAKRAGQVIATIVALLATTRCVAEVETVKLWNDERTLPKVADLLALEGVEFHVIKPRVPEQDGYNWLHGVALAWHKEKLYSSFGHNRGEENTAGEQANCRVSGDSGKTWGPLFQIDDRDQEDLAVSHGVFLSHAGQLWAFQGAFYGRMEQVHTRAYLLDERTGRWRAKGVVVQGDFWPMQEPLPMDDGNWIMAGLIARHPGGNDDPAAVAITHGDDFTQWDLIAIHKPPTLVMWGESTVIVDGPNVLNIARHRPKALALAATSRDFGRIWSTMAESNLPMATSKPYAGTLSTGQRFLICTTTADSGKLRHPLTIAVSDPGDKAFSRVYCIRDAISDGVGESHPDVALAYPYAVEHDGKLYVGYSNSGGRGGNRNSAELAVISVRSLASN